MNSPGADAAGRPGCVQFFARDVEIVADAQACAVNRPSRRGRTAISPAAGARNARLISTPRSRTGWPGRSW